MALRVPITLIERDGPLITYEYTQPDLIPHPSDPTRLVQTGDYRGVVTFDQETGEFTQITGDQWDDDSFYAHVCRKLAEHFQAGEVPEATEYAA
jgi:hypothetical protein